MSTGFVRQNLAGVLERIERATRVAGREAGAVRLVAVSKTLPVAMVRAAYDCGQRAFGENRVPELQEKVPALPSDCEWHLIGHLQKNKVRSAVCCAHWIHSVDSEALLTRIDRIAGEEGQCPKVLLQVNVSGEETKSGIAAVEASRLLELALTCENVQCRGFMTMAPFGAEPAALRHVFGALRLLRDRLGRDVGCDLPELSMGMSQDFEAAIEEGATLVRVGTAVFGARN